MSTEKKDPAVIAMEETARQNKLRLQKNKSGEAEIERLPASVESPIMGDMNNRMMASLVGSIIPTIRPMIEPAIQELEKFLADDENILIVRRLKGVTLLFVLDKTKGTFEITNDKMDIDEECVVQALPISNAVESILKGELFKP